MLRRLPCLALVLCFCFATGGVAAAAEPPDPHDPCVAHGKDTCGTTGVGAYRATTFGPRWFGDYDGAVAGVDAATFCIDLRFWYPSKSYSYAQRSASGLKSRAGKAVSAASLRKMSYAIWRYGRTNSATSEGAVMLYVHKLMGDGAPGEVDPADLSAASRAVYGRLDSEAARFAGPYKLQATLPGTVVAGQSATLTLTLLSATGKHVPDVTVDLSSTGAGKLPASVNTGDDGVATVPLTASTAGTLSVDARANALPAATPALYVPTHGASARNGQRLVGPAGTSASAHTDGTVVASPTLGTQASSTTLAPGSALTDTVNVAGLAGQSVTVDAALYGPYASPDAATCTDTPVWTGSFPAAADGTYTTAPVTLPTPGYYTYRESVAASATVQAVQTKCADTAETTLVRGSPAVTTAVSAQTTAPGAQITDTAVVSGLGKLPATVNVALWGPFPTRAAIACSGTPAWTGTLTAAGDGSYTTAPATLAAAGYYTYQESIAATSAYDAVTTVCADTAETTLAKASPAVTTAASDQVVRAGGKLTDKVVVSGLGTTPVSIDVELFGPYATRADVDCSGTPYWKGTLTAAGNGTFTSPAATVNRAGFYVFRETIAGSETVAATQTQCAVAAETALGAPEILTGRGDPPVALVHAAGAGASDPARVTLARLGVAAPVDSVGIDTHAGALGIPTNIHRVGWWHDSAAPGDAHGAILLAGHIDSAKDGAGAFFPLQHARKGDVVTVSTRDGKTHRYRVTSVRLVLKDALPTSIFSTSGGARLVLVTCGGPFQPAIGHYKDNVVVTAAPA